MKKQQPKAAMAAQWEQYRISRSDRKQYRGGISFFPNPCYFVLYACALPGGGFYITETLCCKKDINQCELPCNGGPSDI
jgi:hypothetical protein